jgi:hypothetical protein
MGGEHPPSLETIGDHRDAIVARGPGRSLLRADVTWRGPQVIA